MLKGHTKFPGTTSNTMTNQNITSESLEQKINPTKICEIMYIFKDKCVLKHWAGFKSIDSNFYSTRQCFSDSFYTQLQIQSQCAKC